MAGASRAPAVAGASKQRRTKVDLEDDVEIASVPPPKRRAYKSSKDEAEGPDDDNTTALDRTMGNKPGRSRNRNKVPEQRSSGSRDAHASNRSGGGARGGGAFVRSGGRTGAPSGTIKLVPRDENPTWKLVPRDEIPKNTIGNTLFATHYVAKETSASAYMFLLSTTPLHWICIHCETQSSEVACRLRREVKEPKDPADQVRIYRVSTGVFLFTHAFQVIGYEFVETDVIDGADLTIVKLQSKTATAVAVAIVDASPFNRHLPATSCCGS